MVFFFFKQKTAYEMRISDWSSDVCSSDLQIVSGPVLAIPYLRDETHTEMVDGQSVTRTRQIRGEIYLSPTKQAVRTRLRPEERQIGRASCRERVCQYV